jgi:kynureninase
MDYTTGPFRWLNGTPNIPTLYIASEGPTIVKSAGITAIREKSIRQTSHLIDLAEARGYTAHAPKDPTRRGGTVAFDVPHGYEVTQHLLAEQILVDYRVGAGIRVAPHFYTRDDELDACVAAIDACLATGAWQRFSERLSVVT